MQVVIGKKCNYNLINIFHFTDFKIHFAKETEWNGKKIIKGKKITTFMKRKCYLEYNAILHVVWQLLQITRRDYISLESEKLSNNDVFSLL